MSQVLQGKLSSSCFCVLLRNRLFHYGSLWPRLHAVRQTNPAFEEYSIDAKVIGMWPGAVRMQSDADRLLTEIVCVACGGHLGRCIYGGIWAEMLEDRRFYFPVPAGKAQTWVIAGDDPMACNQPQCPGGRTHGSGWHCVRQAVEYHAVEGSGPMKTTKWYTTICAAAARRAFRQDAGLCRKAKGLRSRSPRLTVG